MHSRSAAPVTIIFSIVVTLVAISLLFTFAASRNASAKKYYCNSIYRITTLYGNRDNYCEQYNQLTISSVEQSQTTLLKFSNNNPSASIQLDSQHRTGKTQIVIPYGAEILSANLQLGLASKITQSAFSDSTVYQTIYFPEGGQPKTINTAIPSNAVIKDVKFELTGKSVPAKVDLVFVIDTSSSMNNEWSTLCTNLDILEEVMQELNVDAHFRIFGMGRGNTYGECIEAFITDEELAAQLGNIPWHEKENLRCLIAGIPFSRCISRRPPSDDFTEAWGIATAWAANNNNLWRADAKKIVIPISDSDPTGGERIVRNPELPPPSYEDPAVMSGNEPAVVEMAKQAALINNVKVFPIYGDKGTILRYNEGFNVGEPEQQCMNTYRDSCGQILMWMKELAWATGGNVTGYKNLLDIKKSIVAAVTLPFPRQIGVEVGSFRWNFNVLNEDTSPQTITGPVLVKAVQSMVDSCSGTTCNIPIKLKSGTEGVIVLDKLRIEYMQEMDNIKVDLNQKSTVETSLTVAKPFITIDFKEQLNKSIKSCTSPECGFNITIRSLSDGVLILSNLEVKYKSRSVEEGLLRAILDCWVGNGYGRAVQDQACEEFVIPHGYTFPEPITESSITASLKERQLCHLFGNSKYGCGTADNLEFKKVINTPQNILIEYKAKTKQIQVS
ncbi:MAG: hypothetical protein ABIG95_01210 [Candidatus Woesearchaeota archaeon]